MNLYQHKENPRMWVDITCPMRKKRLR